MDLLATILGSILAESGRVFCLSLCTDISSTCKFKSNVKDLEKEIKNLIELRDTVKQDLESAENDSLSPAIQVRKWLEAVQDVVAQAKSIENRIEINKKKTHRSILNRKLSKKIAATLGEVKRLEKHGKSAVIMSSINNPAVKNVEYIPGPSIEDQATVSKTLAEIINHLENGGIRKIGIWGMGGIGKTTLVKALNNKLCSVATTQRFGLVIWVTVSKNADLKRVQTEIAERLSMQVKVEATMENLAKRLHMRLKCQNFLLILDDVWNPIDLDVLGVPQPGTHKGSKIILTSRFLEVCRGMTTDLDVRVRALSEEESWLLFCLNAGEVVKLDRIRPIAKAVSRECDGLPLAIITMGTAMRGKGKAKLWKIALKDMRRSVPCVKDIEEKLYKPLKWSYDSLQGKNIKSCFLYCSLFPEDFSIEVNELVNCWLAEGLIEQRKNYEDSMNTGIKLIEDLKDSCLLEQGSTKGTVKMHDVVRDVAIWIASSSSSECRSLVLSGIGLHEISEHEFIPYLKRVSLMNNKLERLPDCYSIQSSGISTLLLQGNFGLKSVPDRFMQAFQEIKVLNLGGTRIQRLPPSLGQLLDLHLLILKNCYHLTELPPLESLIKLQVLDLCATSISELPKGTENLINLRELNLSRTHNLKTLEARTISKLSRLEVLDMTLSSYHFGVREFVAEGQVSFQDLRSLIHLLVLSIRLECVPALDPVDVLWLSRLHRFQFFIGPTANSLSTKHDKRRVTISGINLSEQRIEGFLINASSLILNHCWGLNHFLENIAINNTNSFTCLKSLTIEGSGSSFRPGGGCTADFDQLPNLEELYLRGLNYLESVSELVGHLGLRFPKLKLLEVTRCSSLKSLLSIGNIICVLPDLNEIKVTFCEKLQELFPLSTGNVYDPAETVAPKLRVMRLQKLPKLRSLMDRMGSLDCIEEVEVIKCGLVSELPLSSKNVDTIKKIRGDSQWWNHLKWNDNHTKTCLQPCFIPDGAIH